MDLALAAVIFLLAAGVQAVTGFGFVLLGLPLLALVVDAHTAVVACVAAGLVVCLWGWLQERAFVDFTPMRWLLIGTVVGVPLGLVVFTRVSEQALMFGIGALVLISALLLAVRVGVRAGRGVATGAGVLSGFLLVTTGTNGPPLVIALQAVALRPVPMRATLQALMAIQGVFGVAMLGAAGRVTGEVLAILAVALPAIVVGWALGERVFRRMSEEVARRVVLVALVINGVVLIATALTR